MPQTAEAHSGALTTNRNCTIEITSMSTKYRLENPKVHMESGFPFSPPQPTITYDKAEVCSFDKDDNTASGAVGVMTYELFNTSTLQCEQVVAIMFSVPFDYNFYQNWLGIGLFESSQPCDDKLFDTMYNNKEDEYFSRQKANGSSLTHKRLAALVRATMSDEGKAIVKAELYDN
ncbi:uncharacterized protein ACB058_010739 isoform 1-T2 [Synchiropus picturatus]